MGILNDPAPKILHARDVLADCGGRVSEQPVFKHRDVEIVIAGNGQFCARVWSKGDAVDVCEESLDQARHTIDRILSRERSRRARPSVAVFLYYDKTLEPIEWRGFQNNSGRMLVTTAGGEKKRLKIEGYGAASAWLIPTSLVDNDMLRAHRAYVDAQEQVVVARERLQGLVESRGVKLPNSWNLRSDDEQHELAIRGKLDELQRRSNIRLEDSSGTPSGAA